MYNNTYELVLDMRDKQKKPSELLGLDESWGVDDFPWYECIKVDYTGLREAMWEDMNRRGWDLNIWQYINRIYRSQTVVKALTRDEPMAVWMLQRICKEVNCPIDRAVSYRRNDD